mmetsp:Transcript_33311/g.43944  ORF Transcript_33311/g.43944 Transcript_33311/m.43944 type:complete len:354 (-) Transcript_33311:217-1278(-)|eukprot:CAMPEP_0117742380 /NCGR_PEP_ID=MMETSP0947-20121206/5514_1 /TAXON_ID=44440 /ORGANISM="Chattonella subsalsa, Strain CCMP2191" /LENGTH=353 /DNA_ID=CAMNT_0005558897 /DNA_START=20 /DNA_END=1081 /DNA_ORIENTATION=+
MTTKLGLFVVGFVSILWLVRWRKNQIKLVGALRMALSPRVWYAASAKGTKGAVAPKPARFARCLVDSLGGSQIPGKLEVNYRETLINGEPCIVLSPLYLETVETTSEDDNGKGAGPSPLSVEDQNKVEISPETKLVLGHAQLDAPMSYANCPALDLGDRWTRIGEIHRKQHVALAACVIVEDCSKHILLIRRAAHMRIFPGAWVLPGGSVDPGEKVATAAARELFEEVGVKVQPSALSVAGLWESCYPTRAVECMESKPPFLRGHHLVVFLSCKLNQHRSQIQIILEEDESDQYSWISHKELFAAFEMKLVGKEINGIYLANYTTTNGIGQGHAFILREYLGNQNKGITLTSL